MHIDVVIFFFFFFLLAWNNVRVSLHVSRLILTDPEVNDQISLQWPLILAITGLEPEITGRANLLISNSYH
jgi:hypothetical protein